MVSGIGNGFERGNPVPECGVYAQRFNNGFVGNGDEFTPGKYGNARNCVEHACTYISGHGSELFIWGRTAE